ncbi:MAG: dihydropteroate synthase [Desulfobacteraceae bacterium]|nr:MAG: dihydropteroate synthase [Desulfobacteraceae bacterium]
MAENLTTIVSSETQEVKISRDLPTVIIGERINPTGRKQLQEELRQGNFDTVRRDALAQVEAGAAILDVNAGIPQVNEPVLLVEMIKHIGELTDIPLCIDTANVDALEAALRLYKGKALVNSVSGEEAKLEAILPLIKESGAAVIGLTMDDEGIPATVEKRVVIAGKIIERATKMGIDLEDIVIDPLALSMGAEQEAGKIALDSIEAIAGEFGVNITMGCSNISFGIPDREPVNAAFMAMAIRCGLTCPITSPLKEQVHMAILAADLCMGRDEFATNWIGAYRKRKKAEKQ